LGRNKEWELLQIMLNANYLNVAVTLHHPEWFRETAKNGKNSLQAALAGLYYHTLGKSHIAEKYLKKIKNIYVLTKTEKERLESFFKIDNVRYLPRIVNPILTEQFTYKGSNIFCQSASLEKEGIYYLLRLHKNLQISFPDTKLFLAISKRVSPEKIESFQRKYNRNVVCIQLPGKERINNMLKECAFTIIVEEERNLLVERSLLYYFQQGQIILTGKKEGLTDLFCDNSAALHLSGNLQQDVAVFASLLSDPSALMAARGNISRYLKKCHSFEHISQQLNK